MNGVAENRYSANWEKLSKRLRLLYHCWICGESEYLLKQVHHIDNDKRNGSIKNSIVLCKKHHLQVDKNSELIKDYQYIQKMLTLAFKSGFKTPGRAFRKFMDIVENHKEELNGKEKSLYGRHTSKSKAMV